MADRTVITAQVRTNKEKFRVYKKGSSIIIEVKEKAEKGKANAELIRELSKKYNCKARILKGAKTSKKIIELEGKGIEGFYEQIRKNQ